MKKVLALFIAVLMIVSAVITVSAASYPFLPDSQEVSTEYTLSYYKWLYYTKGPGAVNESVFVPNQTAWLSLCPECQHQVYNFVKNNRVLYFCSNCDYSGTYPLMVSQVPTHTYVDPEEGVVCPNCNSDNIIYASTTYTANKLVDNFVCGNCKKAFTKDSVFTVEYYVPGYGFVTPVYPSGNVVEPIYSYTSICPECRKSLSFKSYTKIGDNYYAYLECPSGHPMIIPVEIFDKDTWMAIAEEERPYVIPTSPDSPYYYINDITMAYKCSVCSKALSFKYYVQVGDTVYARFECEDGHPVLLPASVVEVSTIADKIYLVNVDTVGSGYYRIADNRPFGKFGEKKSITFTAKNGYQLADVTVNGVSYGAKTTIEFTLKSEMNITATFIKVGETYTPGSSGTSTTTPVATTTGEHAIAVTTNGKGTVTAKKNNIAVEPSIVKADKKDTVVYTFEGENSHYVVSDVKLDGKSIGAVSSYTFKNITSAHVLEVEYKWKSPFSYIAPGYEDAVEYVTESGILEPTAVTNKVSYFSGTNVVSIKAFACALAKMQDVEGVLNTEEARELWAIQNGLIGKDEKTTKACNIQTACRITETYLKVIEKKYNINFLNFDEKLSTEQNGINIGLVSHEAYEVNREVTRYDIAAVCYLIKRLPYSE